MSRMTNQPPLPKPQGFQPFRNTFCNPSLKSGLFITGICCLVTGLAHQSAVCGCLGCRQDAGSKYTKEARALSAWLPLGLGERV